jgi:hypothetical protein
MSTPSVLDLSFATSGIVTKIKDWQVLLDLGSVGILGIGAFKDKDKFKVSS